MHARRHQRRANPKAMVLVVRKVGISSPGPKLRCVMMEANAQRKRRCWRYLVGNLALDT